MPEYVTIPVEPDTKAAFKSHLRGGERQDDLLRRMIDAYDQSDDSR